MARASRDLTTAVAYSRLAAKALRAGDLRRFRKYAALEARYRAKDARRVGK